MLTPHIGYSRVAYELRLTLHLDNPAYPTSTTTISSRPAASDQIAADPSLAALGPAPPLAPPLTPDSYASSVSRTRDLPSPNAARLAFGLPVTIERRDASNHLVEEQVQYPKGTLPHDRSDVLPPPVDADLTRAIKQDWASQNPAYAALDQPVLPPDPSEEETGEVETVTDPTSVPVPDSGVKVEAHRDMLPPTPPTVIIRAEQFDAGGKKVWDSGKVTGQSSTGEFTKEPAQP